jgi:enoyl-CoA hydratase/carnithine racemase
VYDEILYEVDDPVATITLNRPDSLNGWTDRMGREVRHAVARAEADAAVVGIVITGAGRAFCAGADLKVLSSISADGTMEADAADLPPAPETAPRPPDLDGAYTYLLGCPKPIIAAINGACAGMAVPIALSCDLRFMAEDGVILTAFAQRGLIAEWGLSWLLPRVVGASHAMDLLISSRKVTGSEAAAMGLVNKAMPADEVLAHSQRYVRDLAERRT